MNSLLNELKEWFLWTTATTGMPHLIAIRVIINELFWRFVRKHENSLDIYQMYNSDRFRNPCSVLDEYYYDAVKGLIPILDRHLYSLDEADMITPDFMGLVHETLLFHVDATNQNARKETGSYYTPPEITDYMVTLTLDEFQKRGGDLLTCKILDPAVGCGEFPVRLFKEIIRRTNPDYQTKRQILNNLHGIDIQPLALRITQARLLLMLIQDKPVAIPDLSANFVCGDALIKEQHAVQYDIVIGNPPYLQLQTNKGFLAKKYAPFRYKVQSDGGDVYMLFYERGWQLLKPHGLLCYITSNKWMRAKYGHKLRQFITTQTNPIKLLDFTAEVFKSAAIHTNILLFAKEANQNNLFAHRIQNAFDLNVELSIIQPPPTSAQWTLLSPIDQSIKTKIETQGMPLSRWGVKLQQGVKTGYDAAFVIDELTRHKLIDADTRSHKLIKPLLRGKDFDRNGFTFNDVYMIATFPSLNINIDEYPAIKAHLLQFHDRLKKRAGCGTTHKWYETQNPTTYWRDFAKTKILFPLITQGAYFHIDENGMYCNTSCAMIITLYPHYLCALLASPLNEYALKHFYTLTTLGNGYYNNKHSLLNLPVINPPPAQRQHIETLFKNKDAALNSEIYKLYGLTDEEIAAVEGVG